MNRRKKFSIGLLVLSAGASNLLAEVKLPAVLSDNMVLQQQSDARFWGWAAPGEKVEAHNLTDRLIALRIGGCAFGFPRHGCGLGNVTYTRKVYF